MTDADSAYITFMAKNYLKDFEKTEVYKRQISFPQVDKLEDSSNKDTTVYPERQRTKLNYTSEKTKVEDPIEAIIKEKKNKVYKKRSELESFIPSDCQIYCMSAEEMIKRSVFTLDRLQVNNENLTYGLYDKRLGVLEKNKLCYTCYGEYDDCDGHEAYLKLSRRYFNPLFEDHHILYCKCTCSYCGHTYVPYAFLNSINTSHLNKTKHLRILASLSDLFRKVFHNHEGHIHEKYQNKLKDHKMLYDITIGGKKVTYEKSIENIKTMYDNYNDDDLKVLRCNKYNHPSRQLLEGLLTVPPKHRLPGYVDGKPTDHYLNQRYLDILKREMNIKTEKDPNSPKLNQEYAIIYSKIKEIFFGPETKLKNINDQDGGITQLWNKKQGEIRQNAMGKRINHVFRSVMCPSEYNYGEVGVPESFCQSVLVREKCTIYNRKLLQDKILSGEYKFICIEKDGSEKKYELDKERSKIFKIKPGVIVERPIKDGDILMSGRQPSLHAASLMGFRAKKNRKNEMVIRNHISVCTPFNADHDGDENSGYVLQKIGSRVEALENSSVYTHIMNEQANRPMMGISFHALFAGYAMTSVDIIFSEDRWIEGITSVKQTHRTKTLYDRCIKNKINPRSSRALISAAFPVNFTYKSSKITIVDGIIVKGILNKSSVGTTNGSFVQILYNEFSQAEATRFINDFTKIASWFIQLYPLSMGHHTFSTNRKEIKKKVNEEINRIQLSFYNLGPKPTDSIDLFFWGRAVYSGLSNIKSLAKDIGNSYLDKLNELNRLGSNGAQAKGSESNTSQITGLLGLQQIRGTFQEAKLNEGKRRLPMFLVGDCSVEALGFVPESFYDGLSPTSMLFHMASSREGLINKANSTADIGYTHRRIVKSIEDLIVDNYGMVSSTTGKIFQFTTDCIDVKCQTFVDSKDLGRVLFFCNPKQTANIINGIFEYIQYQKLKIKS